MQSIFYFIAKGVRSVLKSAGRKQKLMSSSTKYYVLLVMCVKVSFLIQGSHSKQNHVEQNPIAPTSS